MCKAGCPRSSISPNGRRRAIIGAPHGARFEKGWTIQPHPQLANVLRRGDQSPIENYKQIDKLSHTTESDPTSRLVLADAALAADIWAKQGGI